MRCKIKKKHNEIVNNVGGGYFDHGMLLFSRGDWWIKAINGFLKKFPFRIAQYLIYARTDLSKIFN